MDILFIVGGVLVGASIGFAIAKYLEKNHASSILQNANNEAKTIIRDAKTEGESKSGKQNQSILPLSDINAAVRQLPTAP